MQLYDILSHGLPLDLSECVAALLVHALPLQVLPRALPK